MVSLIRMHYGKRQLDFVLTYGDAPRGYLIAKSTGRIVAEVSNGKAMVQGRRQTLWQVMGYHSPHEFLKADERHLVNMIRRSMIANAST